MSLYTQGFLRTSSSGKFVGVLKYRDPEGSWRQVTKTFGHDREAAERDLVEWRERMEAGAGPAAADPAGDGAAYGPTVEEAVRALLASQLARGRIERSTHDTQLAYSERDLFPELGSTPLSTLTTGRVQSWLDALCERVSPGSASIPYAVLAKTFALEERAGRIARNPLAGVDPPRQPHPGRAFLPDTSVVLLERAVDETWGPGSALALAVRLALYAGLRAGECCGLRWRDVGAGYARLRIASSVGRASSGCYVKGPKNASSAREMPVVPALSRALAARADAVGGRPKGAWFCCGSEESFMDPRRLSREFSELCGNAGVINDSGRRATFHQLRHTFATRAVHAGVDVRTLADLMGHARADMTLNVYAASGEDAKAAAIERLSGMGRG